VNKYHARATVVDGIRFASLKEAARYGQLKLLLRAGMIDALEVQPRYEFWVKDILIGRYKADFRYFDRKTAETVVEDVKSKATRTEAYRLRKKLMLACHRIKIREV
jgi:Protein of unknown function (DUF1064)